MSVFSLIQSVPPSEVEVQIYTTSKFFGGRKYQIQILALQPPGCVTLDNLLNLSELQFSYL